jgi:hypothetical protein
LFADVGWFFFGRQSCAGGLLRFARNDGFEMMAGGSLNGQQDNWQADCFALLAMTG